MPKTRNGKRRNPIAYDLAATPKYRKRVNDTDSQSKFHTDEKKGSWSRDAKHKGKSLDEGYDGPTTFYEFYQVGDKVDIEDGPLKDLLLKAKKKNKKVDATIREPNGPANTVGITIDGEFHLIDEDDIKLITEGFAYDDYEDLAEWSMVPTKSGISIPISSEEGEIIEKCKSKVYKNTFDEREQEVARKMVGKGVLTRGRDDKGIYFTSGVPKLTRS